jgi:hypothetical protein
VLKFLRQLFGLGPADPTRGMTPSRAEEFRRFLRENPAVAADPDRLKKMRAVYLEEPVWFTVGDRARGGDRGTVAHIVAEVPMGYDPADSVGILLCGEVLWRLEPAPDDLRLCKRCAKAVAAAEEQ